MHNARATLVLQLLLNGTNIVLDVLFVTVFHWNVAGVAWATLISEYFAMTVGLWLLWNHRVKGRVNLKQALAAGRIKALLQVNFNIFIRTILIVFAFSYFTVIGTKLGSIVLAANAVLLHLQSLMAYGLDGFAHAAEALVGSEYGKRNRPGFRWAVKISTLWALLTGLLFTAAYYFWGDRIVALITTIEEVKVTANQYMPWLVLLPLISVWSFQLDGIFIGTTHTREMRDGMIIATFGYLLCTWFFVDWWHNHGLWLSLVVFMILRAVSLGFWYGRIESSMR
jgi:MATE family multidrug resistance protein